MTVWDYWNERPGDRRNLRLMVPGRGWVAYEDRLSDDGKVEERGSKEYIDSAAINALSASNFITLTGAGASFCARNAEGDIQPPSMSDLWNAVSSTIAAVAFAGICAKFQNSHINDNH